jgi:hypothetical protein
VYSNNKNAREVRASVGSRTAMRKACHSVISHTHGLGHAKSSERQRYFNVEHSKHEAMDPVLKAAIEAARRGLASGGIPIAFVSEFKLALLN